MYSVRICASSDHVQPLILARIMHVARHCRISSSYPRHRVPISVHPLQHALSGGRGGVASVWRKVLRFSTCRQARCAKDCDAGREPKSDLRPPPQLVLDLLMPPTNTLHLERLRTKLTKSAQRKQTRGMTYTLTWLRGGALAPSPHGLANLQYSRQSLTAGCWRIQLLAKREQAFSRALAVWAVPVSASPSFMHMHIGHVDNAPRYRRQLQTGWHPPSQGNSRLVATKMA
jgi:hypothetical protein